MDKKNFAFGKWNYILLAVGVAAIILGFALMEVRSILRGDE